MRRMPLAKNSSWELVYHINTLFVSPWKFKSSCITHLRHDSGLRTVWIVLARIYFKGLAGRAFFISVFVFEKHCAVFLVRCLGSVTNWVQRKRNFSVICSGAPNENIVRNHLNKAFKRMLVFKR